MAMPRRPPRHHNLNSSAGLSTAASALILSADRPFAGGRPNWPPLEARSFAPHLPRTAAGRTLPFQNIQNFPHTVLPVCQYDLLVSKKFAQPSSASKGWGHDSEKWGHVSEKLTPLPGSCL